MQSLYRPTRLKLSHNPTAELIKAICKKQKRDKRKRRGIC